MQGELGGIFIQYRIVAAKEGALSIYHFRCSLVALRALVGMCPKTKENVDIMNLRKAARLVDTYFPNANNIRHAIAHAGEVWTNPKRFKQHALKNAYVASHGGQVGTGSFQAVMLFGRIYSISWEGRIFEVNMDSATTVKLQEINSLVDAAFS